MFEKRQNLAKNGLKIKKFTFPRAITREKNFLCEKSIVVADHAVGPPSTRSIY